MLISLYWIIHFKIHRREEVPTYLFFKKEIEQGISSFEFYFYFSPSS